MKQKKEAEDNKKIFEETSPASTSPVKEEKKTTTGGGRFDMHFDVPKSYTNASNQAKSFPTFGEESKYKPDSKKGGDKKEADKPVEAAPASSELPRFTNTKKRDDKPTFAKLEEQKEHVHDGELIAAPYAGANPREFKVAGEEREKKEYKPYHAKAPRKEFTPEAPKEQLARKETKKEKVPPKVDDKKAGKAGDKVATFSVDAPAGVTFCPCVTLK